MSQIMSAGTDFFKVGCEYLHQYPVDSIQIFKTLTFDWAEHFDVLPQSLTKACVHLNLFDEGVEVFELLNCLREFAGVLDSYVLVKAEDLIQIVTGEDKLVRSLIPLIGQSLCVAALLGTKLLLISSPAGEVLLMLSTLSSLVNGLQEMYEVVNSLKSTYEHDSQKRFELIQLSKTSFCLIKNLTYLSGSMLGDPLKGTILLSCGSAVCATKIALFMAAEKKIFNGEN